MRSVAVVLGITGRLRPDGVEVLAAHLARFTALGDPLVVDVAELRIEDGESVRRLVSILDAECHLHATDWVLVADTAARQLLEGADEAVLHARSVPDALQHFIGAISSRRNLRLAT
ncbi:hypothetical protein MMAD_53940 [Mycolicibacterium madagascariense]|uniref:STAS domain-containing protein n=1 Tax=Mycolicibacterium madagascariense TaxID=212765 RepID=A0A7I7XPD0_9MYCO|nr:hypothetical protein [Mycolicibacterium madagascariense]MCV7014074.1 hypothetical protein [Mycolicibacterium madagascariense]BBZ31099.1 hypothetical protein MMAD_53940 [Mycolicibacterium madagascariense]